MAKSLIPLPVSPEREQEVLNDIQLSEKPLYVRSRDSDVHIGTKIIFEIQNEGDIKKLQPLVKLLGQSSGGSPNDVITEVRQQKSRDKSVMHADSNDTRRNSIQDSQESRSTADIRESENSKGVVADCSTPSENLTMDYPKRQEDPFLLTPEFFQYDKALHSVKSSDSSPRHTMRTETTLQSNSSKLMDSSDKPLKLKMPSMQYSEYYNQSPSMPYQQNRSSLHEKDSPNTLAMDSSQFQHPLLQASYSTPLECSSSSPHMLENIPRVKVYDRVPVKSTRNEHPNDYRVPLNKSYMEERNFALHVLPGIFYDTPHGILVEMKNGSNYEIGLTNNNSVSCDVDVFVDMELVYKVRMDAYSKCLIDGPKNIRKKFVFFRAFDAPPEANITNRHERNGQIKAVFKPKMVAFSDERKRAWSADSAVSCPQFLNQALGNIMGPPTQGMITPPPPVAHNRYRSVTFCSGATALQGNQRDKIHEFAEYMEVDENRTVVLQLRLVASVEDQSRPSTDEPIVPLITKMPPPLPF